MSNDIRDILERLTVLEGRITPTDVKSGLNAQQKSVKQLPALFKPKDISPTLSKTPYQKHPMDGWLVGEEIDDTGSSAQNFVVQYRNEENDLDTMTIPAQDESHAREILNQDYPEYRFVSATPSEQVPEPVSEAMANEDMLDKVKKSFADYLSSIEDKVKDEDIKDKKNDDTDLKKKDKKDRDLLPKQEKHNATLDEDPTQDETTVDAPAPVQINPVMAEGEAVKAVDMHNGQTCEIVGNLREGFKIRRGNRSLKSVFKTLEEAEMALEMFNAKLQSVDESSDYVEEK